jgi:serine protease Do
MGIGEIGEKLRRSTVQVRSGSNSCGSGIVWDRAGIVVTNDHVVRSANLAVEFWDGRTMPARVEKRDARRDLAVLRVATIGLDAARHGDSRRVRVGELVIAVGSPFGFTGALSTGVVHGVGPIRGIGQRDFIQTTARLAPGNSGGPLADAAGDVIGINAMVISGGLGLAVPSNAVERLLSGGPPVELGVTVRPVRIPGPEGGIALLVLGITPGSAAEYASLRIGDVLVGSGNMRFYSPDDLQDVIEQSNGRGVRLRFRRGGERNEREVTVRLLHGVAA